MKTALKVNHENIIDLSVQKNISKTQFMSGALQLPFVVDMMRAETFWQDSKISQTALSQNVFSKESL